MTESQKERHPFRFMFRLLLIGGLLAAVVRFVSERSKEFVGLSESEARRKFEEKLGPRIGEDKASAIADQVIPAMKERGIIKSDLEAVTDEMTEKAEEAGETVVDLTKEAGSSMEEAAKETVEKIEEKVD